VADGIEKEVLVTLLALRREAERIARENARMLARCRARLEAHREMTIGDTPPAEAEDWEGDRRLSG
jgi:hypothetical protein